MAPTNAYTTEQKDHYVSVVCASIATSEHGLAKICKANKLHDSNFPSAPTILSWMTTIGGNDPVLAAKYADHYARSRDTQADYLADQIIEIADDRSCDTIHNEDGTTYIDQECIRRSILRVDARKWIAAKLKPRKYGDNVQATVEHTGNQTIEHKHSLAIEFVSPAQKTIAQQATVIDGEVEDVVKY